MEEIYAFIFLIKSSFIKYSTQQNGEGKDNNGVGIPLVCQIWCFSRERQRDLQYAI